MSSYAIFSASVLILCSKGSRANAGCVGWLRGKLNSVISQSFVRNIQLLGEDILEANHLSCLYLRLCCGFHSGRSQEI